MKEQRGGSYVCIDHTQVFVTQFDAYNEDLVRVETHMTIKIVQIAQ